MSRLGYQRKTKIIATLGPSSSTMEKIEALYRAGTDIFRLNFSHGTHDDHLQRIEAIRSIEKKYDRPITILADLQGPKLRVGNFKDHYIHLEKDQQFQLDLDPEAGDQHRIYLPHPEIFQVLEEGAELLLDDGKIRLKVVSCTPTQAQTVVVVGGMLSNHKGVNVPGLALPISVLTEKDRVDLAFALQHKVDVVALSFVQHPQDIVEARELIQGRAKICAKIEKPLAIEHIEEIINESDMILIARGDLGVEMPLEDVPCIKKKILRLCLMAGKPVTVATQILESMIDNPTPTRAEVSDLATAVYEGADTVMLSAESASGKYPVEAVEVMDRVIRRVETDPLYRDYIDLHQNIPEKTVTDAVGLALHQAAGTLQAKAIVTFTVSGATAVRTARERPIAPILALTPNRETARFLNMCWGVCPIVMTKSVDLRHAIQEANMQVRHYALAQPGDKMIVSAGVMQEIHDDKPVFMLGGTNFIQIVEVAHG